MTRVGVPVSMHANALALQFAILTTGEQWIEAGLGDGLMHD